MKKPPKIFLSYSSRNSEEADQLYDDFYSIGIQLIRDTRDAVFAESITTFMQKIGKSDYVIMLISDAYLKSYYCMYEVVLLLQTHEFEKRVLPIIVDESLDLYDYEKRVSYYKYWDLEVKNSTKTNAKLLKKDLYEQKKGIELVRLYLDVFFDKFIAIKTVSLTALKNENYESLYKKIKYTDVPLLNELKKIDELDLQEQKIKIDEFLTKYPKFTPALYRKGHLCSDIGQYEESKYYFKKLFDTPTDYHCDALVSYGAILSNTNKDYSGAKECFQKAIAINPLSELAYSNLGVVYRLTKNYSQSIEAFKKVVEINPTNKKALTILGALSVFIKDYDNAKKYWETCLKLNPTESIYFSQFSQLLNECFDDVEGAIALLNTALSNGIQGYDIYNTMAILLEQKKQNYEDAIAYYLKASAADPNKAYPLIAIGILYADHLQDEEKALDFFYRAIIAEPKSADVYRNLGTFYSTHKKDHVTAKLFHERGLALDPNHVVLNYNLGTLLYKYLNDKKGALPYYEKVIEIEPNNLKVLLNCGAIYYDVLHNDEKAIEYYERILALNPEHPLVNYKYAQLFLKNNAVEKALEHLYKEIAINPKFTSSYINVGVILNNDCKDAKAAKKYFLLALALDECDFLTHYNLINVNNNLFDYELKRKHFTLAKQYFNPEKDDPVLYKKMIKDFEKK